MRTIGDQLALAGTIGGQVAELTGDGHGHHVPGTSMVYRHGWELIAGGKPGKAASPADVLGRYKGWRESLTPAQDRAMRFYQSPGFALMNGQLRGIGAEELKRSEHATDADLRRARKATADLAAAIGKAPPLERPLTVHRGFDAGQFGDLAPGRVIRDPGFTSTSLTDDAGAVGRAESDGQMTLTLPAGTKAAAGSVRELVLPPGSRMRVTGVSRKGGTTHVTAELLLAGAADLAGTITAQLDLTGDARHRHIPGSPYEWRHGWIPLTRAAAMSHFHGHVPSSWHPASEAGRLSAPGKHGEEKVSVSGENAVRSANVERARTGYVKRGTRQSGRIGGGMAVAGGVSDVNRPIAEALTSAVRTGHDHYVIPTMNGMASTSAKPLQGRYIKVTPDGSVSSWGKDLRSGQHLKSADLPDEDVSKILDEQLSKTRQAEPEPARTARPAAKPGSRYTRKDIARTIRDIGRIKSLQNPETYAKVRKAAEDAGALDLIPSEWGKKREETVKAGRMGEPSAGRAATAAPARETAPEHAAVSAAAGRMRDAIKTAAAKDESIPSWERHDKAVSGEVPAAMSALDALERASSGGDVQAIGKAMQSVDDSISRGMHSDGRLGMDGSVKAARNALAEAVVSRQGGIALGDISPSARHVVIEDPLSGLKSYNDLRDPESLRSYAQQAAVRGLKISEASGPPDLSGVPKSGQQLYKHAVTHGWNASLHVDHDSGGKPIYTVVAANPETRQTSTQSFVQGKRSTYNAEPVSASLDRITQNPRGKYAAAADVPAARASADARALASDMRKTSRTGSPEHTAAKALAGAVRDIGAGRDPGSAVRDVRDLLAKNLAGAQAEREQMLADQARGKYVMLGDVGQRIERTQGLLKRAEALHAATAKAPAAQAAAPSAPAHTDFMSDAERQAAEAKYAKVMKAPGSPRYVAQAEHEMKQGRYGNAIGLMERADTLESNEGVGPSGPSRRAIVATITGLRAKQAEHIRAQRAKEAPAPAPTISEQLAMFGERTTSGKDVTSGAEGTLAPGDWHAGYQAIGAAPLDALPSERSRQVDHPSSKYGVNVKGAWSDPVWVAKPGGGFAISARWKSKAQKVSVYGGGPARTVDHPAHDERVIIPVDAQGRTAKQSAEQELKAEQARQAKAAADKAEAVRKAEAARVERQAAAEQKSIERNNRLVAEQRARNEQEAARKAAGAQTAQDRGLTEGARVFVDSGKHKGGIATVRSVGPDGRTMVEHYGGDLETMAPDHLRTQPSGAEETRRMNAVHEADKAKQQMAEQAKREAEAAERNSRGMDRMFARSAAGRQHFQEVTGFPFPQQERFAPDITEAEGLLSRGKLAEGAAALDRAIAAHEASQRGRATKADQARVDRVRKLRDRVAAAAANPRPTLPALAKVHGTNRKGSFTALDHAGNEYRIALRDDGNGKQVFVERDGQTLSAPAGSAPDITARELAGRLIEASLPEPERNRRQAAEMSMHAQELSARGGGYGHESIGYQIGQAAEALKSGDRQRAEALLRQAAMNDADTGRRVYSRTYGSAQEIIAKHLDRLSAGGSAAAPRAGGYEVDSSGGVTTVTTPDGYRLSDHTTEAQFNPQQTGQKLHDRIQRALASAPGRSPENARALADAQAARRAGRITQRQQDLLDQENDRVSMDLDTMAHGTGAPFVSSQFMDRNKPGKPAFGTIGQQLAAREPAKPAGRDYVVTAEKNPPGKGAVTGLRRMTLAEARQSQFASSRASSRRHVVHADTLAPDTGAVDSVQAASSARYSSPEVRDQVGRAVAAYTYGNYEDARASAAAALQSETNAAARAAISRLVRVIEEDRAQAVSA